MEKINVTNIVARIKAKTPVFWVKIRKLAIGCGAVGGAIVALPAEHVAFLPTNTAGFLITIGAVGTALASLTVQDHP